MLSQDELKLLVDRTIERGPYPRRYWATLYSYLLKRHIALTSVDDIHNAIRAYYGQLPIVQPTAASPSDTDKPWNPWTGYGAD